MKPWKQIVLFLVVGAKVLAQGQPTAPSLLTAKAVGPTSINLTWKDNSTNETGFSVERSADGTSFTALANVVANATSYPDQNLTEKTKYYYRVRAFNGTLYSPYTAVANATTMPAIPNAPSNLVVSVLSATSIKLTWQDNSTNEDWFYVERSTSADFASVTVAGRTAKDIATFTNSGLAEGIQYFYRLRALNASVYSAYTASVNAFTFLATPTTLAAVASSSSSVQLSWKDNSAIETGYSIERSTNGSTGFNQISSVGANVTSFTDGGLSQKTLYYYRVKAMGPSTASAYSNTFNITTLPSTPNAPSGLTAVALSTSSIRLTWADNATDETGYSLERANTADFSGAITSKTMAANSVTYSDVALSPGMQYFYRVKAVNATVSSAYSSVATGATLLNAPSVPVATVVSASAISIGWADNSTTETGFVIERSLDAVAANFVPIATTAPDVKTFKDENSLLACTRYYYRVKAVNAVSASAYTVTVNAVTSTANPIAPTLLTVTAAFPATVNLVWKDNSTNETGFQIERSTLSTTSFALVAKVGAGATTYSDATGLLPGSTYYYRVRAFNGGCNSGYAVGNAPAFIEVGNVSDQVEFNALKDLFTSTNGAGWLNKTNWPTAWPTSATSAQMATWAGVSVQNGDIYGLTFDGNNLSGPIPQSIYNLPAISVITMRNNAITGQLPTDIPVGNSMAYFDLTGNKLTGIIPSAIEKWANLHVFMVYGNKLTGSIPPSISKLRNSLYFLSIGDNQLSGNIPEEFYDLSILTYLYMNDNNFSGPLSESIGKWTYLHEIWCFRTGLSGNLPAALGNLKYLNHCYLYSNNFTGELPTNYRNLTSLQNFWIHFTQVSGNIPDWMGEWTNISTLAIGDTKMTGSIPATFKNLTNLTELYIERMALTGGIPDDLQTLQKLTYADFKFNNLTGTVPAWFMNMPSLTNYILNDNKFIGLGDFSARTDKASLTLNVENNAFPLADIEKYFTGANTAPFKTLTYSPQRGAVINPMVSLSEGNELTITAPSGGPHASFTWEKQNGSTWADVSATNQSTVAGTFNIKAPSQTNNGTYRYKVTNTWLNNLTVTSDPITVNVLDAELPSSYKAKALYNGTIASVRWRTDPAYATASAEYKGMYLYDYDEKYQLKEAQWAEPDFTLGSFTLSKNKFRVTSMAYDPNGNIQRLNRYNADAIRTNNFVYTYAGNTNQLDNVTGYVGKYTYNAIGQMIAADKTDASANDQYVDYDVTGKVTKVYSDAAKQYPTVAFTYDDRGFRLIKTDYANAIETKQTWYIRDASGNVTGIYERTAVEGTKNPVTWNDLVQAEVPIYGSGKIGTYYPRDGSTAYELTDHLGNVRAILKKQVNQFTATMEDNGAGAVATNPRAVEAATFKNITQTAMRDARMNHTAATTSSSPAYSAYLYWVSGMAGIEAKDKAIGPALALKVNPRDKLNISTWAKYEKKANYARNAPLTVLATALGGTFAVGSGLETATRAVQAFNGGLPATLASTANDAGTIPFAYLNYLVLNEQFVAVDGGARRVPESAGFDPGYEALAKHDKVEFLPITITTKGYVYIWVSNESEATKVWFDDLSVTHNLDIVTQATDYGPWGDVVREQKTNELDIYRYAYQGQYAEKDDETGWEHFQLREYDPVIGRTHTIDPARQFHSSYVWVGNNPISGTDPTGGLSPIYNLGGKFLGTDNQGLQGEAIFMHESHFTQGMAHESALEAGFTFSQFHFLDIDLAASAAVFSHQNGLSSRPDWDGFVTIDEGVAWALAHPGALSNPTPDNSLYINSALLDFGDVSTSSFAQLNTTTAVNLFSTGNTLSSTTNGTLRATVYALGRVNMQLIHRVNRQVSIVNDDATDYDWNRGGGIVRDNFIKAERARTGVNDSHGFKAYYYGIGTLRK